MAETPSTGQRRASLRERLRALPPETIVRWAALALIPALLLAGYLLRSSPEAPERAATADATSLAATSAPPDAAKASTPSSSSVTRDRSPAASAQAVYGESAAAAAPSSLGVHHEVPGIPAVDLPEASQPSAPSRVVPAGPVSPCGGLFARLITYSEDKRQSFASLAKGYTAPAEVLHIGDSIAGYRVTGIEWDRVWVQSPGERCAVGMHFGARDAQEQEGEHSAEQYAALPWVLPHAIVSGLDKRSEMDFVLDEAAIAALYERGADLFAGMRFKVIENQAGEVTGLSLHDVRLDSFLERLGLETGDILTSIDQREVRSVRDVASALEAARGELELGAEFLREGEPFQLRLRARDAE